MDALKETSDRTTSVPGTSQNGSRQPVRLSIDEEIKYQIILIEVLLAGVQLTQASSGIRVIAAIGGNLFV